MKMADGGVDEVIIFDNVEQENKELSSGEIFINKDFNGRFSWFLNQMIWK